MGVAPGGDVTMAIDEIAEQVTESCCAEAGDIAFYSEDRGYVEIGRPRAILLVDPIDGTRPAAAGLESCCVSVAVVARVDVDATLGDVEFGVVHEIKIGAALLGDPRRGARVERADGSAVPVTLSGNTDLARAVLDGRAARPPGRAAHGPARRPDRRLVDARRLLRSRLGDVQHDAHRHRPARRVRRHRDGGCCDELPELEAAFRVAGDGAVCTNFPYDVAAAALIVTEAGGVVTAADGGTLADQPAVGSGEGYGVAVLASASAALHEQLLDAVDRGMARFARAARARNRPVH